METLCWSCKNACGNCDWSLRFDPVKGWNAKPTLVKHDNNKIRSYIVSSCPEYEKDRKWYRLREIADVLGISIRSAFRWNTEYIISEMAKHGIKLTYDEEEHNYYEIN